MANWAHLQGFFVCCFYRGVGAGIQFCESASSNSGMENKDQTVGKDKGPPAFVSPAAESFRRLRELAPTLYPVVNATPG